MKKTNIAIIGAGPYGLSVSAHLAARNIDHRIFGQPMQFWRQVAQAGKERYLKSYCFATNLATPQSGFSFADYNTPRGLETFEPCSIRNFADYGEWFQQANVPWLEPFNVEYVGHRNDGFLIRLSNGDQVVASKVIVAIGLTTFSQVPSVLAGLPPQLVTHTSNILNFADFKGRSIAVIGAGQSALEAAALLNENGAHPHLLVRENTIDWQERIPRERSPFRRLRSPLSGLGAGPRSWALTNFPNVLHRLPETWRSHLVKTQFGAAGAWWLRPRVENQFPIQLGASTVEATEQSGRVKLLLNHSEDGSTRPLEVDHVVCGTGYVIDVDRIRFFDPKLRAMIERANRSPKLDANFGSSVPGLHFVGTTSAMSFGPLFRFVVGAQYTAQTLSAHLGRSLSRIAA